MAIQLFWIVKRHFDLQITTEMICIRPCKSQLSGTEVFPQPPKPTQAVELAPGDQTLLKVPDFSRQLQLMQWRWAWIIKDRGKNAEVPQVSEKQDLNVTEL